MDVIGRVESGTETESDAVQGRVSGFLFLTNPEYLHPCRQYFLIISTLVRVLASFFIKIIDML